MTDLREKQQHLCAFMLDVIDSLDDSTRQELHKSLQQRTPPMSSEAGFWYSLGALEYALRKQATHATAADKETLRVDV